MSDTVEGRLADIIEDDNATVCINEYKLSPSDRTKLVGALRMAAAPQLLICYMKDGSTRYVGPFYSRAAAQRYGKRVEGIASHEVTQLLTPIE